MRGTADAERLAALGVPAAKIFVEGDVKLEAPEVEAAATRAAWRSRLGLTDELLIVAGSTHPGEEAMLVAAWSHLLATWPGLRLVIAPRHVERAPEIQAELDALGLPVVLRSQNQPLGPGTVYLLDTVGELADLYAAADVAFVGGSLIERGGHNVLEPVLRGVPVLFGPYTMNFRSAVALVLLHRLGQEVPDAGHLAAILTRWLADQELRAAVAPRAARALEEHRGAAARIADHVLAALARTPGKQEPEGPAGSPG